MILDGVVGPSLDELSEYGPFVAVEFVEEKEDPLLLLRPGVFDYGGVEMVVPSFATLLALPVLHEGSYHGPLGRAVLFD